MKRKDLAGRHFGRLVAIEDVGSKRNRRVWRCLCSCGNEAHVSSTDLICGGTKSCGCLLQEKRVAANIRHGDCGTRLYRIWKGILSRCRNKGSTSYKWYGKAGVSVCDAWSKYEIFRAWAIENGYRDDLTIDRINPFGDYSPENCRWVTTVDQNKNRRKNFEIK